MAIDIDLEVLDVLQDAGQTGALRRHEYAILQAEFGDGFYRAALIGDTFGLWSYTLTWSDIPRDGLGIQRKAKNGSFIGAPIPRSRYMIELHAICMSAGNKPFWFQDFDRPGFERLPLKLVRFTSPVFEMQQSSANRAIWSYSADIQEVRGFV
jgi:hypothetical protein